MSKKCTNLKSLASQYGVSVATFKKILKEKGIVIKRVGNTILPKDVERIYKEFGMPSS